MIGESEPQRTADGDRSLPPASSGAPPGLPGRAVIRLPAPVAGALVAVALIAGCAVETPAPNAAPAGVPPGAAVAPVCLEGAEFVADGEFPAAGVGAGDAETVSAIRWEAHPGCERVVLDLARAEGSPAAAPGEVRGRVIRGLGLVRVFLPGVAEAAPDATEERMDGDLARAAYVVRSGDEPGLYFDVHLADAAEAYLFLLREPARVVVDLRPGGGPIPPPAVTSQRVVLIEPRPGPASYPLQLTGYARTFEANVVARIERNGETALETFTTAAGWLEAWGQYSLTIDAGPSGPVRLHVGEYSARDGTWEGVAVDLEMR